MANVIEVNVVFTNTATTRLWTVVLLYIHYFLKIWPNEEVFIYILYSWFSEFRLIGIPGLDTSLLKVWSIAEIVSEH